MVHVEESRDRHLLLSKLNCSLIFTYTHAQILLKRISLEKCYNLQI